MNDYVKRSEIIALIEYYEKEFPDDNQILGYLKQAVEKELEVWVSKP